VEATVVAAEAAVMVAVAPVLALIWGLWTMGGFSITSLLRWARALYSAQEVSNAQYFDVLSCDSLK
jgi:hypothetical protein